MEDDFDISSLKKKKKINSRNKGNSFERKICGLLNEAFKTAEFSRSPGSGAFATTHSLPKHLDLQGDILTPKDFPYMLECKKGYNKLGVSDIMDPKGMIHSFFNKVSNQAKLASKFPMLIFQQDRKEIFCMVSGMHFPEDLEGQDMRCDYYLQIVDFRKETLEKNKDIEGDYFLLFRFSDYLDFIKKSLTK